MLKGNLDRNLIQFSFFYLRRSLVSYTTCLNLILTMFVYSFWKSATTDASAAEVRVILHLMWDFYWNKALSSSFSGKVVSTHEACIYSLFLCDLLKFSFSNYPSQTLEMYLHCTLFLSPQPRLWVELNKKKVRWLVFTISA